MGEDFSGVRGRVSEDPYMDTKVSSLRPTRKGTATEGPRTFNGGRVEYPGLNWERRKRRGRQILGSNHLGSNQLGKTHQQARLDVGTKNETRDG